MTPSLETERAIIGAGMLVGLLKTLLLLYNEMAAMRRPALTDDFKSLTRYHVTERMRQSSSALPESADLEVGRHST